MVLRFVHLFYTLKHVLSEVIKMYHLTLLILFTIPGTNTTTYVLLISTKKKKKKRKVKPSKKEYRGVEV